jgi:subtilase family serine protease
VRFPSRTRTASVRRSSLPRIEVLESRSLLSAGTSVASTLSSAPAISFALPKRQPAVEVRHHEAGHSHHQKVHPTSASWAKLDLIMHPLSDLANRGKRSKGGANVVVSSALAPYDPGEIRHAYGIDQLGLTGTGQTIAIVDAYDDPTIANDLQLFDEKYGLPNPNFVKATPDGTPSYNQSWAGEIALDVEWSHAVAPGANILLVEVPSASLPNLMSGVDYAVSQGAHEISMSWTGGDFRGERGYDSNFQVPGVTFLAATGDNGAGANYPATSPYVTAVGGTSLEIDGEYNRVMEVGWSGSGGGTDRFEPRPYFQSGSLGHGHGRSVPDVSYNADPNTGYLVYDSSSGGGWSWVGGTSAATPQWAGLIALANQGRAGLGKAPLGTGYEYGTNQILYALAGSRSYSNPYSAFYDITAGSNGYDANAGYNRVAGLGAPVANELVPYLIGYA